MFHFTIRVLLLVMLVVAVAAAWCLDHFRLARLFDEWERQARFARIQVKMFGWEVTDDYQVYPATDDAVWPPP